MSQVRGFLRIVVGYVLAMLIAGLVQVLFALPPTELASLSGDALIARASLLGIYVLAAATHSAIFAVVFAAVAIALAEWQRVRNALYYVMTGIAIALAGFLAQYASENAAQPTIVNTYALLAYVVTGAIAGAVYWAFSGNRAGGRSDNIDDTPPGDGETITEKRGQAQDKTSATSVPVTHRGGRPKPLQVA